MLRATGRRCWLLPLLSCRSTHPGLGMEWLIAAGSSAHICRVCQRMRGGLRASRAEARTETAAAPFRAAHMRCSTGLPGKPSSKAARLAESGLVSLISGAKSRG